MNQLAERALHLEVRVADWRYPRHVVLRDETVEMEVARTHCSHCSTCSARINRCKAALVGRQFERRSAGGGEYFVLPYPVEAGRDPDSVAGFLREMLQLPVSAV